MENISSQNPIDKIEFLIKKLVDFANENEFDFVLYQSFANENSKTFNRYFALINNENDKAKIISDLETNFHYFVDDIVTEMLSTIDNKEYPKDGKNYYVRRPIPDTRIRSHESNYKQLIELFLNSVEFDANPQTKAVPENEQNKIYFKLGLLFAQKKIFSKITTVNGIKTTKYHYENEVFDNPNQLSKRLNLGHQYINDSFKDANTNHNIFNNLKQLKMIVDYCNKNAITIDVEFLDKYTTLVENKR